MFLLSWCYFLSLEILTVSSQTMAGTQRALTIYQYHKIESECFGEESGLPPANSKYIRWHVEVCRASYAL